MMPWMQHGPVAPMTARDRRTRSAAWSSWTVAALAVLGGIIATGLSSGRPPIPAPRIPSPHNSSHPAATGTPVTPVTDPSGLRWLNDHGYLLPVSPQAGPRTVSGGLASGFADTPLGALVAMISIAARTAWQFGPAVFQPIIEHQVAARPVSQVS
jgi:hypothetical protein